MFLILLAVLPTTAPPPPRSLMFWLNEWTGPPGPESTWAARLENIKQHASNLTHVSPCIYALEPDGSFGVQTGGGEQGNYSDIAPHIPALQAMGLKIIPIIYNIGGASERAGTAKNLSISTRDAEDVFAMRAIHDGAEPKFIKAAVDKAVTMGYAGYNFDNELRGGSSESSWDSLKSFDALHAVNKTLSVDIAGCCGWADVAHPSTPLGHCTGGFANHEFVYTSCAEYEWQLYAASKLDVVYGMSSYNAPLNGPPWKVYPDNGTINGPAFLKMFANHSMVQLGGNSKYGLGFKNNWPYSSNYSVPADTLFDDKARETLDYLTGVLGIRHAARWHNEPRSQAEWDAWGYFLHGAAAGAA